MYSYFIKLFLLWLLFFVSESLNAQGRTNFWYFAGGIGLDFSSGNPVFIGLGNSVGGEGCSTISDTSGNLLFYTGGWEVNDTTHNVMQFGGGIFGSSDAAQSSVIIPQPGNDSIYYLFTNIGLRYSVINMNLNNGLGVVTKKNVDIISIPNIAEKLAAVHHCNGIDVWVMVHEFDNSSKFLAYLVTDTGIVTTPVISNIGAPHTSANDGKQGYMKFSPNGKYVALVTNGMKIIEMFEFDNSTGTVYNKIFTDSVFGYGISFSPLMSKLYFSNNFKLFQYDISSLNEADIINSRTLIYQKQFDLHKAIQIGSDGKVYVTRSQDSLGVINNPDSPGLACNYDPRGVDLNGWDSQSGLPNFIESYFNTDSLAYGVHALFSYADSGLIVGFSNNSANADSYTWDFGDGAAPDTSKNPTHTFASPGTYTVCLYANGAVCGDDNLCKTITVTETGDGVFREAENVFVQIFPNPVTHRLFIRFREAKEAEISLYNTLGQKIQTLWKSSEIETLSLPMHNFSPGFYLLNVKMNNGVIVKRVVVTD